MALELNRTIRVHQALHGYADGHRLLTSSVSLTSRDQKTMLFMSDVSGSGANIDSDGYLTGYPLPDSGVYAVGRTWAATEMARPGCVWTHTFLLDFADLALLPDMGFLEQAFRRPLSDESPSKIYSKALTIDKSYDGGTFSDLNVEYLKRILSALYGFPKEKVLSQSSPASTRIALLIWAQQWPRLRRTFRFCTLAFADRSSDGMPFDLQFAPTQERSIRSRFTDVVELERVLLSPSSWLDDAVSDIAVGRGGDLRTFLKEVGGDVAGGREMFAPLCLLHHMIPHFGRDPDSIDEAISIIDNAFDPTSARSLRALLVTAVARHPENVNGRSADFLLKHLDHLSPEVLADCTHELGDSLWKHKPAELLALTRDDLPLSVFARETIANLDARLVVQNAQLKSDLLPELLSLRPSLIELPELWSIGGDWARSVLQAPANKSAEALRAILVAERSDLAYVAAETFGGAMILQVLTETMDLEETNESRNRFSAWFDAVVQDAGMIAAFLSSSRNTSLRVSYEIAMRTQPETIPNEVGADPWATAIKHAAGHLNEHDQHYLSGYLLARAFGYRSASQSDLIEYAFDGVYFGARNARLADDAWQLLERSLPRSWWFDWDHCQRLRGAITDMFVNRDLPPEGFTRITRDNKLFAELSRIAAYNSRGRKYLKKVLRSLKENGGPDNQIRILEDII